MSLSDLSVHLVQSPRAGDCDCAARADHGVPGTQATLRASQKNRPLDVADLDVRFGDWRDDLLVPLPDLPAALTNLPTRPQAYFEQNDPHPDPLPSDGRGNSQTRLWQPPKRWDTPTDGGRFSLSHPMGEGRGEGECGAKSEVVFAWVLSFAGRQKSFLRLVSRGFPGLESTLQIVKLRERQVTHLVAGLCAA